MFSNSNTSIFSEHNNHMCRTKKDVLASHPKPTTPPPPTRRSSSNTNATPSSAIRHSSTSTTATNSASLPTNPTTASSSSSSSSSAASSLASLRLSISLPDNPTLYPFADISAATNNFLSKRLSSSSSSSSSSSWRCSLRGKDVVVFQRAFRGDPARLPSRLSALCKSHHSSLVKLLGASVSGQHIYLVYEYVAGASLQDCLRNPRNPNFTPLSKWISRMQVATDLAEGMDYVHRHCGTIHNRITSSSVIVTEPNFNAKICHFGASDLTGEIPEEEVKIAEEEEAEEERDEISVERTPTAASASPRVLRRSDSRPVQMEGTIGYIAPEVIAGERISHRSDVFAFGVVILELISGREPLKYTMNRETKDYGRISLIETARDAIGTEDEDGASETEADERRGRIRRWVDRRLRDSFPVEAAEKLIRVALRCVEEAPFMRPETQWVAGKVSKLFLDAKAWEERVRVPTDFSVSLAPR